MFLCESLTDDEKQSFEYESFAEPLLATFWGVRVYSLVPDLCSTSHCMGSLAWGDCHVARFPVLSVERYEVPHDSSRD